jgi:trans-aconitate 2-methyltransferase
MASTWNPDQYHRFRDERRQPFFDLLSLVDAKPGMRVADLGCGTGELTQILHERLGARETVGIDSSETMLAKAPKSVDGLSFRLGDLAALEPGDSYDVVFSNAALQWILDHPALIAKLTEHVRPGGQLAVQVPANFDEAPHLVAAEVAREEPFRAALGGQGYVRTPPVLAPIEYARLLDRLGYREQKVRLQVYGHNLGARDDVVEWVKGTLLTDYQRQMSPELFAKFLERYRERLLPELEDRKPFFFPFKRILFWARR